MPYCKLEKQQAWRSRKEHPGVWYVPSLHCSVALMMHSAALTDIASYLVYHTLDGIPVSRVIGRLTPERLYLHLLSIAISKL